MKIDNQIFLLMGIMVLVCINISNPQIVKQSFYNTTHPISQLIRNQRMTYIIQFDYSNRSLIALQFETQKRQQFNVLLENNIKSAAVQQFQNGLFIVSMENGTAFQKKQMIQSYDDQILQMFEQPFIKGHFILTRQSFFYGNILKTFIARKTPERVTKLFYSQTDQTIYFGTENGSLLIFKDEPFYEASRVLYYNFQQTHPQPVNSLPSEPDYPASSYGTVQYGPDLSLGFGSCANFNGSNYLVLNSFGNYDNFTVAAWFKTDSIQTSYQRIVEDWSIKKGFTMNLKFKTLKFEVGTAGNTLQISSKNLKSNTWYHCAGSYNKQTKTTKLYLDGQLIAQGYKSSLLLNDTGPLTIGGGNSTNTLHFFYGSIDQVMFFNTSLQPNQVKAIFQTRKWKQANIKIQGQITCLSSSNDGKTLYLGDNKGSIYTTKIKEKPIEMEIDSQYNIHSSPINSISEYRQQGQQYIISSDQSGQIIMSIKNASFTIIDKKILAKSGFLNVHISKIFDGNKFVSVSPSNNGIIEWEIMSKQQQTQLQCDQIYLKCEQNVNFKGIYCQNTKQDQKMIVYITQDGQLCIKLCGKSYNLINGKCIKRSQAVKTVSNTISTTLSLPSVRRTIKIFMPIFIFLQDIWFYSYHNRNYSQFIQTVFQETNRINLQRIVPDFLDLNQLRQKIDKFGEQQFQFYAEMSPQWLVDKQKVSSLSYWQNTKQILIISNLYTLASIVGLLLIGLFVRKYIQKYQTMRIVSLWLLKRVSFIYIIFTFIELNLGVLGYHAVLQLKNSTYVSISTKFTMVLTYVSLFILIIYSLCFYWLVLAFSKKKSIKIILNYTKIMPQSFTFATITSSSSQLANSFIHCSYQLDYRIQISLLGVVNILQVFAIIRYRKCFQSKCCFAFVFVYQLSLTLLDLVFLLGYSFQFIAHYSEYIEISLVAIIAASVLLLVIYELIIVSYSLFKNKRKFFVNLFKKIMNKIRSSNKIIDQKKYLKQKSAEQAKNGELFTFKVINYQRKQSFNAVLTQVAIDNCEKTKQKPPKQARLLKLQIENIN